MTETEDERDPPEYAIVRHGWRDHLPAFPRPVLALPGNVIWKAFVHGSGFRLPSQTGGPPIGGFYTTYFVSAATFREASDKARKTTKARWAKSAAGAFASGALEVEIETLEPIDEKFRWRSGRGYIFYPTEDAT